MIFKRLGKGLIEVFISLFCIVYLLILSALDILYMKVSNIVITGFLVTIVSSSIKNISEEAVLSLFFFLVLLFVCFYITHGLGSADIKIMTILAYASGFFKSCLIGILACLFGISTFIIIKIVKGKRIQKIPFVPCIAAGYITSFLFGEMIV